MTKLRMAVVGCGPIGRLHAAGIAGSDRADLVAVCDLDAEAAASTAASFDVRAAGSVTDLLATGSVDAVTVATPDDHHVDVALEALEAGCHVFCEKPLAATARDAKRLVKTAADQRVQLGVDYNRRFGFGYRKLRELLDAGRVGEIGHALVRVIDFTPPPEKVYGPFCILTRLLTHHIDLLRSFAGEIVSVHAEFRASTSLELMSDVVLSLRFAGAAVGTIVSGFRDRQARTSEWFEVCGSDATVRVHDVTRRVEVFEREPDRVEVFRGNTFREGDAFHDTIERHVREFIASIADGRPPPVGGVDGLRGLEIVEAAVESHEKGRPVTVRV